MMDLCIYCVITLQDEHIPTIINGTGHQIYDLDANIIDKIVSGEWKIIVAPGKRLPVVACCTTKGTRVCYLHAMTESQDPRNRMPNARPWL